MYNLTLRGDSVAASLAICRSARHGHSRANRRDFSPTAIDIALSEEPHVGQSLRQLSMASYSGGPVQRVTEPRQTGRPLTGPDGPG